jgi:hypothetical protein
MNLIDLYVTEVLSEPYEAYNHWFVDVMADGYGSIQKSAVMLNSKEEADNIDVGYKFLG